MATYPWGYSAENGPDKWADHFPLANGRRQSPIDIDSSSATYDNGLAGNQFQIKWSTNLKEVMNNGRSFVVETADDASTIDGGPLANPYTLVQFHMHWGADSKAGSEHTVNGKTFPAELHFVHKNSVLYNSFQDASMSSKHDGLCVIGILVEIGDEPHPAFERLIDEISTVEYRGFSNQIANDFDPSSFLPKDTANYWTYPGSLTTPPCYESVTWIVLKEPIKVTADQLDAFRNLRKSAPDEPTQERLVVNNRPPLRRYSRIVRATFLPEMFAQGISIQLSSPVDEEKEEGGGEEVHEFFGSNCDMLTER